MVKATLGNFFLIGIMAMLFILLTKSVAGVFNLPDDVKAAVFAV